MTGKQFFKMFLKKSATAGRPPEQTYYGQQNQGTLTYPDMRTTPPPGPLETPTPTPAPTPPPTSADPRAAELAAQRAATEQTNMERAQKLIGNQGLPAFLDYAKRFNLIGDQEIGQMNTEGLAGPQGKALAARLVGIEDAYRKSYGLNNTQVDTLAHFTNPQIPKRQPTAANYRAQMQQNGFFYKDRAGQTRFYTPGGSTMIGQNQLANYWRQYGSPEAQAGLAQEYAAKGSWADAQQAANPGFTRKMQGALQNWQQTMQPELAYRPDIATKVGAVVPMLAEGATAGRVFGGDIYNEAQRRIALRNQARERATAAAVPEPAAAASVSRMRPGDEADANRRELDRRRAAVRAKAPELQVPGMDISKFAVPGRTSWTPNVRQIEKLGRQYASLGTNPTPARRDPKLTV